MIYCNKAFIFYFLFLDMGNLSDDFICGWDNFCKNPGEYSLSAARDLISDYWDFGAAVLTGFAFSDAGTEVVGEFIGYSVGMAGFLTTASAALWKADHNRNNRNILAGAGCLSLGGLSALGISAETLESYVLGASFFMGSYLGDISKE